MSESESFLSRWARRKQDAQHEEERKRPLESAEGDTSGAEPDTRAKVGIDAGKKNDSAPATAEAEPFDIDSLPSIESINAATDIRDFLRPGVPADLSRAALRRAWTTDPAIRDFIGLSENAWDFTEPNDILGFGLLHEGDDIRRMVAEVFGDRPEAETLAAEPRSGSVAPQHVAAQSEQNDDDSDHAKAGGAATPAAGSDAVASQYDPIPGTGEVQSYEPTRHAALRRRTHGGALPQ